jgi:hypothetical protein
MFLDESYDLYNESSSSDIAMTADPYWGAQIICEAVEAYNKIDMAMINLEHTAIVNEDAALLEEGKKSFGAKVKQVGKNAKERFLMWLAKVHEAWSNLTTKIKTTIFSKRDTLEKAKKAFGVNQKSGDALEGKGNKINIALKVGDEFYKVKVDSDANLLTQAETAITNFTENKSLASAKVDWGSTIKLLQWQERYTEKIEYIRKRIAIISDDDKSRILAAEKFCSRAVSAINAGVSQAIHLVSKALSKHNKEQKKAEREAEKNNASESVLDRFMFY